MPEEGVKLTHNDKLLTGAEIVRLIDFFVKLGVNKVRFTGGEPLVRKDCVDIIRDVGRIEGLNKIAITTNGILLSKRIKDLKEYGLNQLNISLDTLEEKKFGFITKRNGWSKVMTSIESALENGFQPLKINCVVMKGLNDDEICNFIDFTRDKVILKFKINEIYPDYNIWELFLIFFLVIDFLKLIFLKNVDVRFIEYMPFDGNKWNTKKMVSFREMLKIIAEKYHTECIEKLDDDPNDTSKAFKIKSYKGQFGFITSMTEHFCNTCNRIRLTADGNLKVCLFGNAEVSLRDALRSNLTDEELENLISAAIKRKKEKHAG
jgi:molybdenum cofactor biosynthesis enzyme MoaA